MAFSPFMTLTLRRLQPISPILCENSCCVTMTALDSEFYKGGRFWNGQRTFTYKWKVGFVSNANWELCFQGHWRRKRNLKIPFTLIRPSAVPRGHWAVRQEKVEDTWCTREELAGWFCCCNPWNVACLDLLSTEKALKTWRDFVHLLSKDRMPSFLPHCMVLSIKHYRRRLWNVVAYMFFF